MCRKEASPALLLLGDRVLQKNSLNWLEFEELKLTNVVSAPAGVILNTVPAPVLPPPPVIP